MPYITQDRRDLLNTVGANLVKAANELNALGTPLTPGDINFLVSSLIWNEFDRKPSYTKANELVGALECAKLEFLRRRLNAYEDTKIQENGDL